jgi:hypothetical protein
MAKQRRNRERATELMSILDELVPAVYPYRAFTSSNSEESSLRKRSRNKTLEDVIAAVNKVLAQAEREVMHQQPHTHHAWLPWMSLPSSCPFRRHPGRALTSPAMFLDCHHHALRGNPLCSLEGFSTQTWTWRICSRPSTQASG